MTHTPNLNLPYIAAAQAQKHITHNEALRELDALVQLSATHILSSPPSAPNDGDRVLVGESPDGAFAGKENFIAAFQDGAWAFYAPQTGWHIYVESIDDFYIYKSEGWNLLFEAPQSASTFGVNAGADAYNKLVVKSPASLFDHNGDSHRLKINKSGSADTASLLFQSGYSGRAEIGLTGDEDFKIKTSADGSTFHDSLIINSESGAVSFPCGAQPERQLPSSSKSGGIGYFYGLPNRTTIYDGRASLSLIQNRVYFTAFYAEHPVELWGGFLAQHKASSSASSVMRVGIYELGGLSDSSWNIGARITDLGTVNGSETGAKIIDLLEPVTLAKGWYVSTVGTNNPGAALRFLKTHDPSMAHIYPGGTGTSVDIRFSGPTANFYSDDMGSQIQNGYMEEWPNNPVSSIISTNSYGRHFFIPKLKEG